MSRLIAWLGLCASCSLMALVWWPFGLIPAVVILVLAWGLVHRRHHIRDVRDRARTDWRQLAAWVLLVAGTTAGLYFGVAVRVHKSIVRQRGTPCIDASTKTPGLQPSPGCDRLAELLLRTCVLRPRRCITAPRKAPGRALTAQERRALDAFVRRLAREQARRRAVARRRARDRQRARRTPNPSTPPDRGGPPGAPPSPSGNSPGSGGGSQSGSPPPGRPSPSDAVNRAKDRLRDSLNDATDTVGAGRPVPTLPDVPATPALPDLVPCLAQIPPACSALP